MTESLKQYCKRIGNLSDSDLTLIDIYFKPVKLRKKSFLFRAGEICNVIGFVGQGVIRHFFYKEGEEKTIGLSFENMFFTDLNSFYNQIPTSSNAQALEDAVVLTITRSDLFRFYAQCPRFESIGRIVAEKVAQSATQRATSLSCDTPEERYLLLLAQNQEVFRRVPQKYIASMLGISPESLSRIRKRLVNPSKILT